MKLNIQELKDIILEILEEEMENVIKEQCNEVSPPGKPDISNSAPAPAPAPAPTTMAPAAPKPETPPQEAVDIFEEQKINAIAKQIMEKLTAKKSAKSQPKKLTKNKK